MPTIQKTISMFEFIKRRIRVHGEAPTLTEIARHFYLSSTSSVFDHLKKMEAKGWIKRSRRWRGIEIVEQETKAAA